MNRADRIDWNDVRFFLAAARTGSLAGAARALGVEHSTVGRRLRAFEQTLGGSLVLRKPDGLVLTALGERVAAAAEKVDREVLALFDAALSEQPHVRLALPSGFTGIFTRRIERLRASHPGLVLELVSSARTVDLQKGEADLAVRVGPIADADLVARRIGNVGWSLYAAPGYLREHRWADNTVDLRGHKVIGYDPLLSTTPPGHWIEANVAGADVVLRSREMMDMAGAAEAGVGIALLPCFLGDSTSGLSRLTPDVIVSRDVWIVYRREMRLSLAVQAVIRFTIEVITDAEESLQGFRVAGLRDNGPG